VGFYWKLAVRNLLRNKRRALIAGTAIGIGLAALIFVDALIIGMERNIIRSATASFLGEGQIHANGFRESFEAEQLIVHHRALLQQLAAEEIVEQFTPRVISFAMVTSPDNYAAVTMVGIVPETERFLSQIDDALREGSYFTGEEARELVIGSKLAEILEVELGSRVVLTVAEVRTGDLSQEMFRVSGIYHFNSSEMDRGMAFIRIEKAQAMLSIGDGIHEVAVRFTESQFARDRNHPFWERYSQGGNEAVSWTKLLPQLEGALELSQFSTFIIGVILFGVVALGIINTLFMSLHERMFEFGVLRAVGTRPSAMALLIVFEAGALAVLSIVIGTLLGYLVTYITTQTGIDYVGIEFVGVTFRELLYPVIQTSQFIVYPLVVFFFTVFVGSYPALYAARMQPAEAMRRSF
jgi:ABC-type lipoprotein release transport system permease subunit